MKPTALVLFSGGLDSRLAVKLLQEQDIEVEAVFFKLPFGGGCCNNFQCVFNYSQIQGVKLHIIDCNKAPYFQEFLNLIQNPEHGYGTSMNPCRDCKIFLFKHAKKLGEKINADIIATGEVLSQRPMSQLKHQLLLTEKKAGLPNKILRPLSAKLLPETEYEKKGLVNRNKLLDIKGRNRKTQLELAEKYNIKFPMPGGGCLLCEKQYTPKLKDLFKYKLIKNIKSEDIQLLSIGRHFRKKGKIILGKDHQENQFLETINKTLKYHILIPTTPGPTVLFEKKQDSKTAQELVKAYSKNSDDKLKKKFEGLKII